MSILSGSHMVNITGASTHRQKRTVNPEGCPNTARRENMQNARCEITHPTPLNHTFAYGEEGRTVTMKPSYHMPVFFYCNTRLYRAHLTAVSAHDACLRMQRSHRDRLPPLTDGKTLELYIKTPLGQSKSRGQVVDIFQDGTLLQWRVEHIEFPRDAHDPLHLYVQASTLGGGGWFLS